MRAGMSHTGREGFSFITGECGEARLSENMLTTPTPNTSMGDKSNELANEWLFFVGNIFFGFGDIQKP